MDKEEETGSPGWSASLFMQTTEDMARAVAAAAGAATGTRSPRPSVVFSSKDENSSSPLKVFQRQVSRVLKGLSQPPEVKRRSYNPEVLTSQKRQWASVHLQSMDHRHLKEPVRLFESMVVVGLHPDCNTQVLENQFYARKSEGSGMFRSSVNAQNQSRVEPNFEPQVLFVYPPDKQPPIKYKDLLSFCFPEGIEVNSVEKTPSMSELNEILLAQEHLKQSDMSFVFRLQVADDSTLYGCCVLVDEIVHKPSGLISMFMDKRPASSPFRRQILTTRRCYCILTRLPLFELHFGVLNSIFTEERLERLTKEIGLLDMQSSAGYNIKVSQETTSEAIPEDRAEEDISVKEQIPEPCDLNDVGYNIINQIEEKQLPSAVLPLLRHYQYESSESSSSFQGSPSEDRARSDLDETDTDEASCSGQEDSNDHSDILKWAKDNNYGSLQITCEYYRLQVPARGSTITFRPLEHLHPLEYHRPDDRILHIAGSTIDVRSCSTSFELAEVDDHFVGSNEAHNALLAEEEATALSVWAVACICGSFRLESVLTIFAGALLEKQIVVVCSNLGILSALVLSIIPLIRPYQWQSLLMPILPNDMLDFLDAPVPYVVGVKNKTSEVQSKLTNGILVDANKNQVRSPSIPPLPRQKELLSSLSPYYAKLVGESYLGRKRPVYECTEVQVEAAKGFLLVLRSYLDSLCSNLRSHTITNVQSNDDKVSLLLKESFIDSFPNRDRPFMKLFVDTQLFSVHTDLVLSFFQKE